MHSSQVKEKVEELAPYLEVRADGPVAIVTLNEPAKRNAFTEPLHDAMARVWDLLMEDLDIDAVVLTGAGDTFSAGGDIAIFAALAEDARLRRRMFAAAERIARGMLTFDRPIVAAVNGPAIGLGCSTALMADLVVLADDAFLSDPHVSVGLVAGDGGPFLWPGLVGLLRAKEYVLLGERVPAADCLRLGLANRVVPRDEVFGVALDLARRLAAKPRYAMRDTKRAFNVQLLQLANLVLPFAFAAEVDSYSTPEVRERAASFLAKQDDR